MDSSTRIAICIRVIFYLSNKENIQYFIWQNCVMLIGGY